MTLATLSQWLSATPLSQLIQRTSWAIPGIQVVHILCLATLFALALNLSLRVAGRGFAVESLASLAARFVPAIWLCLLLLFVSGTLLIVAEPERTITNPAFYVKMTLLILAIALTVWLASVARRQASKPTPVHVFAAVLCMIVWSAIIVAGRYIAYVDRL